MPKVKTAKSPRGGHCPNPSCPRHFNSQCGVSMHLFRNPICDAFVNPPEEYAGMAMAHSANAAAPDLDLDPNRETTQPGDVHHGRLTPRQEPVHPNEDVHHADEDSLSNDESLSETEPNPHRHSQRLEYNWMIAARTARAELRAQAMELYEPSESDTGCDDNSTSNAHSLSPLN